MDDMTKSDAHKGKSYNKETLTQDQAALDLHKIMLQAMRSRETEILRFLGFLLPAIAGFLAVGWFKAEEGTVPVEVLLPAATVIAIIILFFGAWYALALSYNYRYIEIVTYYLQRHLKLDRFLPDWDPKEFPAFSSCFKSFDYLFFGFAPEIFRAQLLLFVSLIFILAIAFSFAWKNVECSSMNSLIVVWVLAFVTLFALMFLTFSFYRGKYNRRLD